MNKSISEELAWRIRVFDSLSFPTLVLRPDRTILAANEIFLKQIDASPEQVVGKTCRDIFNQYFYDDELPCSEVNCPLSNMLKDKKGHSILRKVKEADGKDRWEDRVFSPILDEDGEVEYIIESVRDITALKNLEQIVSGIQELMDKVVQSSASAIVAADRKGKIILMNHAAEELLEYTPEEVEMLNVRQIYPEGLAKKIMKKLRNEANGGIGKLPITTVDLVTKSGMKIPVEMTAAIIYEEGKEAGTMGIFSDLRERLAVKEQLKEAKAQVIQSEKLASLGRLAAGVAHEINNPLTSITLYGNIILEKLGADHPMEEYMRCVLEDADRCREIVKNLLTYSRQTGSSREQFQLNSLVEDSLKLIRDQKLFMNIQIVKNTANIPISVIADKKQLSQVIINLVINAIDAMDGKGVLTFATYRSTASGMACLEVTDTGCGIPDRQISKVFDPFFTTKKPGKGTGLGLSTVYGIVKENKGRITIKNTGPEGTTFLLELPYGMADEEMLYDSIG